MIRTRANDGNTRTCSDRSDALNRPAQIIIIPTPPRIPPQKNVSWTNSTAPPEEKKINPLSSRL
ncbi:MAG TPA: hypothetical protein VFF53_10855 [Geobacteraceae bacterium]|nr:hypothetical protein [Geobacteraceae bacterium]